MKNTFIALVLISCIFTLHAQESQKNTIETQLSILKDSIKQMHTNTAQNKLEIEKLNAQYSENETVLRQEIENYKSKSIKYTIIILSSIVLIFLAIALHLLLAAKRDRRNLIEVKNDTNLELQSIEKEFMRESRSIKKSFNKVNAQLKDLSKKIGELEK